MGFMLSSAVGLVAAIVLLGLDVANRGSIPLTAGHVSISQLSTQGGYAQELSAYTGDDPSLSLATTSWTATVRPVAYDASHPPTLSVDPFSAPGAGAAVNRIDRLWAASCAVPAAVSLSADGVFDETGLVLNVNNHTHSAMKSPVLVSGSSVYRMPAIPEASSSVTVRSQWRNLPQTSNEADSPRGSAPSEDDWRRKSVQFVNGGGLLGVEDILRAEILAAFATRSSNGGRINAQGVRWLAGWTDQGPNLIAASTQSRVDRSLALASCPLFIHPSAAGRDVQIDAGFNSIVIGSKAIPIYDPWEQTWVACSQEGAWEIGLSPPHEIGPLSLTHATMHAIVSLPMQTMTIRRQQVRDGKLVANLGGDIIVQWSNTFGSQPVTELDLSSQDVDHEGVLWLSVTVSRSASTAAAARSWQITDLGADFQGRVKTE
jgi:hypothetical protein